MIFSQQQIKVLSKINDFLDSNDQVFTLNGYAGTGKTTILKKITSDLITKGRQIRLMAPTGRASMILTQKTNISSCTIHRSIYNFERLYEGESETDFKTFYKLKANRDNSNAIYIIDEASMISDKESDDEFFRFGSGFLMKDLFDFVFGSNQQRKIIFIGDNAQLEPGNMKFSPALDIGYLKDVYKVQCQFASLTKVFRQKNESGILQNATELRKAIDNNSFESFSIKDTFEDVSVLKLDANKEVNDQEKFEENQIDMLISAYTQAAKKDGVDEIVILSHSNKKALYYNNKIRELRYTCSKFLPVQVRDKLIITKNNYNGKVDLFNGMFATVLQVSDIVINRNVRFKIKGGITVEIILNFREVRISVDALIEDRMHQVEITSLLLDDFLFEKEGRVHPYVERALYIDVKNRAAEKGIKSKTGQFNEFLRQDKFFNCLQAKFGYAITGHKSQGGEWKNVVVDLKTYLGKYNKSFFRWSYTAITRASKMLYCLNAPSYNALSEIIFNETKTINKSIKNAVCYLKLLGVTYSFIPWLEERLRKACIINGIDVSFDAKHQYCMIIKFTQLDNLCIVKQHYGNDFFTKRELDESSSIEFQELCFALIKDAMMGEYAHSSFDESFKNDLYEHIDSILSEVGSSMSNIVDKPYCLKCFFNTTEECSGIDFYYKDDNYFSKAIPFSTNPESDAILKEIVNKFDH